MEEQKIELKIINMADIQSQEIEWLWYPFIPYGKLTIIQGDPGDGKTTLVLNLAAKLSKGIGLDEDMQVSEPMNIIYQTAEDGLADTVKPRLEVADADCEKIMVINESEKSLSMIDERLEQAIVQTNARLLILDPIQAYLGGYGRKFTKYKTRIRSEIGCFGNERFIFKIQNCAHRGRTGTGEKRISGQTRSAGEIPVVILL